MGRREYPRHANDPVDRFLSRLCLGHSGADYVHQLISFCEAIGHPEWMPLDGTNGTKRMSVGHALRRAFPDNILRFPSGATRNLEESQ